jgi:peptidoglycan/xylan/chitin deacetylase (PgdA/CDA1 family)
VGGWNEWDDIRWAPHAHMDADALRRVQGEGAVIGSHTRTHRPLVRLDAREVEDELRGSQQDLEALLGRPVRTLAYPGGAEGESVAIAAARCYDLAFATDVAHDGARCPRFRIPRFDPCFYGDLDAFRRELDARCGLGR